jgi:iron complex transport system ATP-binding protein
MDCRVIQDPVSYTPMVVPVGRHQPATPRSTSRSARLASVSNPANPVSNPVSNDGGTA